MCGRAIIQLTDSLDEVENIGVIQAHKQLHQQIEYKFLSLLH